METRILIVDDDVALLEALPRALRLRLEGVEIDTVDNAGDALVRIIGTDYDAIVSDIKMPGMDGLAVLEEIRKLRPKTPTLLITGHGEHDLAVQALRGGAYDFVQKPIDRDYFVASLERAIEMRRLERKVEAQRHALERHARVLAHVDNGVVHAFQDVTEPRALDELKGEFVATISHELRTPLAAIYGSAQTLQRRDLNLDDGTRERLLDVITAESERLTRIAGDILLANTLDSGRLRLETGRVDLGDLANDVVQEMRSAFAERQDITISLAPVNGGTQVSADPDKLRQVLINLIDNAVKYSPECGRVEVEVEPRDSGIRVVVRDEGIGIPGNEQQRIFGKFYRVDPQLSRGVGGTGLGLYICRELVRRMQGRITVESREGAGSTFCVDLPMAPVAASERQAAVSEPA